MLNISHHEFVLGLVLFPFLTIFISIVAREVKKKLKIPVSTFLMIYGVLISRANSYFGVIQPMSNIILSINEQTLKLIFFPVLIFEGAININWYLMKKELIQIFLLSTTLVIINTILTGISFYYVLGYELKLHEILLMGLVLSSTDHIAIAGILEEVYIPEKLRTLISGESMLSEVAILILFEMFKSEDLDFDHFIAHVPSFVRLIFGGIGLGIAFAVVIGFIVERKLNDLFIETNMLFVGAYLLFWLCESSALQFSGALATVTFGLYIAAYGSTIVSTDVQSRMYLTLEIIARNLEAITFAISGILIANNLINQVGSVSTSDYLYLFAIFPLTYVIRAVALLIHYPFLKFTGYGITWKEFIVLTFSGIKGIIATSLAIAIANEEQHSEDSRFTKLIIYFSIGTVTLSISLGSIILKKVVGILGFDQMNEVQESMMIGVSKALIEANVNKIEEINQENDLSLVNWKNVSEIAGPAILICHVLKASKIGKSVIEESHHEDIQDLLNLLKSKFNLSKHALKVEIRRRYLSTMKGFYFEYFRSGLSHGNSTLMLVDSCNNCLDDEESQMKDWEYVRKSVYSENKIKILSRFSKLPLVGSIFRKLLYNKIMLAYDGAHTFIKCHEETEELMDKMDIDTDKNLFDEILKEAKEQTDLAEQFLTTYILDCYPEVLAEVQTIRCSKSLLYMQKKIIDKIYENGVLKEQEYEALNEGVESAIKTATFYGFPSLPILRDILLNRFSASDITEINYLLSKIKEVKVEPGELIYKEGEEVKGAYYIIRGRINEYSSWVNQELIIGNIVGVQHLLQDFSTFYTSSAKAITYSLLAQIPKEIFNLEGFAVDLYKEASEEMLLLNREKFNLGDIDQKYIIRVVSSSHVQSMKKGKNAHLPNGAIVFRGQPCKKIKNFIKPQTRPFEILSDSILLVLPEDFSLSYSKDTSLGECFKKFCVKINTTINKSKEGLEVRDLNDSRLDDTILLTSSEELKKPILFKKNAIVPIKQTSVTNRD